MFNAEDARIGRELIDQLADLWREAQQRLLAMNPDQRSAATLRELAAYREKFLSLTDEANRKVDTSWQAATFRYAAALKRARKSLDFSSIDPTDFFPDEGFPPRSSDMFPGDRVP